MRIVLAAVEQGLVEAWNRFCGDLPDVTVHHGSILDVTCDAVVSPANSFGFMDGGIDGAYLDHFGRDLQGRVQSVIHDVHDRELLVGQADIVPTRGHGDPVARLRTDDARADDPHRHGEPLPRRSGDAAALSAGRFRHGPHTGEPVRDHVRTVAFPGLGTGVGRVPFAVCARQVRAAIDEVLLAPAPFPDSWAEASERHQLLYTDRPRRLQWPGG